MERPETRYAWNGDVALAYQVIGEGSIDLVYLQGMVSNVDLNWESPHLSRFLKDLGSLGRLIVMDRRGWGCSDRFSPSDVPQFETLTDDLLAVLEAVGSERAAIFASFECTAMALLFAATHPERASALMLCDALPVWIRTDETPWLPDEQAWEKDLQDIHDYWGTPGFTDEGSGWAAAAAGEREWYTRMQRATMTPGSMVAEFRAYMRTDVRAVLRTIQVPTLVFATAGADDPFGATDNGRLVASRVPGARLVEIPIAGRLPWHHWYERAEPILDETRRFLGQLREEEAAFDRVLATVLFTDIVDSTATAATMGDTRWRALVAEHDRVARAVVGRYRGTFVRGTGDGMLATFDGPARAVRCAETFIEAAGTLGVQVRAGVHTGEITYGGNDLAGIGVHVAARVAAQAGAGEVWVSSTVRDLTAGSGLAFEDRGEHELKGVPDRWHLYRVTG